MDKYTGMMLDNRYELLEAIGFGGMAVVYKARCHRLNRLVAVKILKEEYSKDADFKRRFETESRAVAMLSHPNIVSVYDVNRSDGLEYIVMELIDGMTLKDYMLKRGRLGWRETLHFATLIAKALEHAHSRGVIHRDIKPHNIMVLRDGSVKVADFGIARFTSSQHTLTQEALGSVHYISPEQARGSQLDARTDIYSLGVVMYEMLTGRLPYDGESPVAVAIAHINSKPVPPHEIVDDVPVGLEYIAMKAMTADLSKRYASATDMLVDLEEFRKNPNIDFSAPKKEIIKTINLPMGGQQKKNAEKEKQAEEDKAPKPKRKPPQTEQSKKKSKIPFIAGIACILLFVSGILYFLYNYFIGDLIAKSANVTVPKFIGITYDQIRPEDYPGLDIVLDGTETSEDYDEGVVIGQDPEMGSEVKEGAVVKLTVSAGEASDVMPDVVNMQQQVAIMTLDALSVKIDCKISNEYSDVVEGYVIRTEPTSGQPVLDSDTVTLYVSLGPKTTTVTVPSVTGLTLEKATADLVAAGLQVGQVTSYENELPEGTVYYQSCEVGDSVPQNTSVNLYLSLGPKQEEAPQQSPEESQPSEPPDRPSGDNPSQPEETEPQENAREIIITLPVDRETVKITVKLNQQVVYEENVACNTDVHSVYLTGTGQQFMDIYFDDELRYSDILDFDA